MLIQYFCNMKALPYIILILLATTKTCENRVKDPYSSDYFAPETISSEAREVIGTFNFRELHPWPEADDHTKWKEYWDFNEEEWSSYNDSVVDLFNPSIKDTLIGGVPVIDIKPEGWVGNGKVLIYSHGGAYVLFSARSSLMGSVPVAHRLGIRVISVDYTNPPVAKSSEILNQIISVVQALLESGYDLSDIGMYGDSAGGALTAGSVLKMRDQGMGMPGALVLISPWADITNTGDTYETLKTADPILNYKNALGPASLAYAAEKDHRTPYVSPVYADFSQGFPPTLIQGGTKEIFMSNFIRLYQEMDQAGIEVKLDLYEGMWHVFQEINFDLPESIIAHKKMDQFFRKHLLY